VSIEIAEARSEVEPSAQSTPRGTGVCRRGCGSRENGRRLDASLWECYDLMTEAVATRRHAGRHLPAIGWKTRTANTELALAA